MEATNRPKAKISAAKTPASGLSAMAASLASWMTMPFSCRVEAQATMMKKATVTVATQPMTTSQKAKR